MKRKKGAKGSFNRVKRNDLLITSDPNSPSISIEAENSVGQTDDCQGKFEVEIEQPSTVDSKIAKTSSIDTDVESFKSTMKTGYSHVKVKLKASKLLDSHKHTSNVQMPSVSTPKDTDKSKSLFMSEANEMAIGKVDITCSDSQNLEAGYMVPENHTKRPGSIKIKSSRGSDFSLKQMESTIPHEGPCYDTKELSAALGVIRKIMKMDAAGPFNAPVNPVALGIPDYFDIIDTPMDFGSICNDLEHGAKYKNALDVYKDVQFIWDNCYKYNNKGDYILELMKRVKKNFMKYWTAAGLLTEISIDEDVLWPHQDKSTSKIKSKKKRRRYGIDGHKSNCLCAVCVVRRRRKEREEHSTSFDSQMMVSHANSPNESKFEVTSADNPCSEGTASSLDRSPETDADAEMDDAGKVETVTTLEMARIDAPETVETVSREIELYTNVANNEAYPDMMHENGTFIQHSYDQECHHSNSSKHSDKKDGEGEEEEGDEIQQEELYPSGHEIKSVHNPPQQENHSVLWLCKELFPGKHSSVWNGPHSFNRRYAAARQNNPMRSALATIMNS